MNRIFLITLTLVLSLGLMSSVSAGISPSYGQQNQTSNTTSTPQSQQGQQQQQNQTAEIGSASQIENMTAGNIPVLGNETDIKSQNDTSVAQGMQNEQLTTDANITNNQTAGGTANETTTTTANQTETGMNQTEPGGNQTAKNPLEQIGETLSSIFSGGGNQSK
jgi:TolA-binding protein